MNNLNQAINEVRFFGKYGYNTSDGKRVKRQYIKTPKSGLPKKYIRQINDANAEMRDLSRMDAAARKYKLEQQERSGLEELKAIARAKQAAKKASDNSSNERLQENFNKLHNDKANALQNEITAYQEAAESRAATHRANKQKERLSQLYKTPMSRTQSYLLQRDDNKQNYLDSQLSDAVAKAEGNIGLQNNAMRHQLNIKRIRKNKRKAAEAEPEYYEPIVKESESKPSLGDRAKSESERFKEDLNALGGGIKDKWGKFTGYVNNKVLKAKTNNLFSVIYDRGTRSFSKVYLNDTYNFSTPIGREDAARYGHEAGKELAAYKQNSKLALRNIRKTMDKAKTQEDLDNPNPAMKSRIDKFDNYMNAAGANLGKYKSLTQKGKDAASKQIIRNSDPNRLKFEQIHERMNKSVNDISMPLEKRKIRAKAGMSYILKPENYPYLSENL